MQPRIDDPQAAPEAYKAVLQLSAYVNNLWLGTPSASFDFHAVFADQRLCLLPRYAQQGCTSPRPNRAAPCMR
jgi:hypothetical protein